MNGSNPRGVRVRRGPCFALLLAVFTSVALTAQAGDVTFSGAFDGGESTAAAWPGACPGPAALAWQTAGRFSVGQAGDYALADAGERAAVDVQIGVYDGPFTPGNPSMNRLALVDGGGLVALDPGQELELIVQRQCDGPAGAWALALSGPGDVETSDAVLAPAWSVGAIGPNAPVADFGDGTTPYRNAGVLRVAVSGFHTLVDVSVFTALDAMVHLIDGAFLPADPSANRVAMVDDAAPVWLEADTDYRVVVTGRVPGDRGAFRLARLPPGAMAINEGLSGGWFEPATAGQGVLLEIYPERRLVFLAWFTFDVEAPFDPDEAQLGDASQRWLTALGSYDAGASSVTLTVSNTGGGLFDQRADGQVQDNAYGTLTLDFESCARATLAYELPDVSRSGVIPLSRVADDNVTTCGGQLPGPGVLTD